MKNSVSTILLQDAIELISGRDLQKLQYNAEEQGVPYIMGASNIKNGRFIIERWTATPTVIGKKGDIILSVKGTVGEFFILEEEEAHLSRQVMALRVKSGYLNEYIKYFLAFYIEKLKEKAKGMIPGITRENILLAQIPNFGLEMQGKIVNVLKLSESIVNKRKAQIEALDKLTQSVFFEMFGDPINNPKEWEVKKLKNITNKILSGATPKGGSQVYIEKGITFLRSQNVWKNRLVLDDVVYIDKETHNKMKKSSLEYGDILMTKTGRVNTENSSLGRAAIFLGKNDSANINGHVYLIRLQKDIINEFILFILTTDEYREYIRRVCVGGIDKRQINKEHLEEFPIISPPIELQVQFSNLLTHVEKLKSEMRTSLNELEDNFNSLLQRAFKGELFTQEKLPNA